MTTDTTQRKDVVKPRPEGLPGSPPPLPPSSAGHLWILWLIIVILAAAIAAVVIRAERSQVATSKKPSPYGNGGVPVVVATVTEGDLPVYITGLLGTVTPIQTVTVRTQVSGQLIKIGFREGQIVQAGKDILFQIDPSPYQAVLQSAQGALLRDQALLANDKKNLERYENAPDAYTDQQRATQKAQVQQDEGNVKTDEGQVASAQVNVNYCTIYSPVTGRVGLRLVDLGNVVAIGTGLVVMTQLQPITVEFPMREQDIPDVIGGAQDVPPLVVEAHNERDDPKPLATGKLIAIDSAVNTGSAMVGLKALYENKDLALYPGQFVNIRLLVKTLHGAVLVPDEAVQLGPEGTFVYLVKSADKTVDVQPVTVGKVEGDTASIIKGLSPGDIVVTTGVDKLAKGTKVYFQEAKGTTRASATTGASATTRGGGGHRHNPPAAATKADQ